MTRGDAKIHHPSTGSTQAESALSPQQRRQIRTVLEAKQAQLLRAHAQRLAQAAQAETDAVDLEDIAEGVIEDRDRAALEEHDHGLLEEIRHALAKLDAGTFGLSEVSGRPIPFKRLHAVPWARCDTAEADRLEHSTRR